MLSQVSARVDSTVKENADRALAAMGLNMSTAINVFLTKVARERRIPFEISEDESTDPFYSESNMRYLRKIIEEEKAGRAHFEQHELIEA